MGTQISVVAWPVLTAGGGYSFIPFVRTNQKVPKAYAVFSELIFLLLHYCAVFPCYHDLEVNTTSLCKKNTSFFLIFVIYLSTRPD